MQKEFVITKPQRAFFLGALFSTAPRKALNCNVLDFSLYDQHQFDVQAMERAFNFLIERNDSLRIYLIRKGVLFYQHFASYNWVNIDKYQVKNKEEFEQIAKSIFSEIPIMSNPLYRVKIVECEDGSGGICMCFHHLLIDGYSIALIYQRLEKYYQAFKKNEILPEEKIFSITKYFELENKYLKSPKFKEDKKFWKYQYNHQPRYSFPAGRVPTKSDDAKLWMSLDEKEYTILFDLCKQYACSYTSMIMNISALTVLALTGEHNFAFYTLSHGRRNFVLKQTIGNMYNNYPVFYDIPDHASVEECLRYNQQTYMEHMVHSQFPTANMTLMTAKETHIKRIGYGHQWCMFSTMDYIETASEMDLEFFESGKMTIFSIFYAGIFHIPDQKRLDISLSYHKKCFNSDQIEKVFKAFKATLNFVYSNNNEDIYMLEKRYRE